MAEGQKLKPSRKIYSLLKRMPQGGSEGNQGCKVFPEQQVEGGTKVTHTVHIAVW